MIRRISHLAALLTAIAVVTPAIAVGPTREVVQERLYSLDGRFDLSILGGLTINNKLIDQYLFVLQPAFQFTDAWAFEITGGYVIALEKGNLTNKIRFSVSAADGLGDEFADMGTMLWIAHAGIRWSPIYGKLSLASVLPIHIGAYASLGGGFIGTQRRSMVRCTEVLDTDGDGAADSHNCEVRQDARPSASGSFGLRFYFADWLAFRAEVKAFFFGDNYTLDIGGTNQREITGLTTALTFLLGASFYF